MYSKQFLYFSFLEFIILNVNFLFTCLILPLVSVAPKGRDQDLSIIISKMTSTMPGIQKLFNKQLMTVRHFTFSSASSHSVDYFLPLFQVSAQISLSLEKCVSIQFLSLLIIITYIIFFPIMTMAISLIKTGNQGRQNLKFLQC